MLSGRNTVTIPKEKNGKKACVYLCDKGRSPALAPPSDRPQDDCTRIWKHNTVRFVVAPVNSCFMFLFFIAFCNERIFFIYLINVCPIPKRMCLVRLFLPKLKILNGQMKPVPISFFLLALFFTLKLLGLCNNIFR